MADNRISLPSGTAGLTRFSQGNASKVTFSPGHVLLLALVIIAIITALHFFGNSLLGIV